MLFEQNRLQWLNYSRKTAYQSRFGTWHTYFGEIIGPNIAGQQEQKPAGWGKHSLTSVALEC